MEVLDSLDTLLDEPLHSVIVGENGLLELGLQGWKLDLDLFVLALLQAGEGGVLQRLNGGSPLAAVDQRDLSEVVPLAELVDIDLILHVILYPHRAVSLRDEVEDIPLLALADNVVLGQEELG